MVYIWLACCDHSLDNDFHLIIIIIAGNLSNLFFAISNLYTPLVAVGTEGYIGLISQWSGLLTADVVYRQMVTISPDSHASDQHRTVLRSYAWLHCALHTACGRAFDDPNAGVPGSNISMQAKVH